MPTGKDSEMSSFVCSDYTVLAIVEGMRKYGLIEKTKRDSHDMAEALRLVNEYMTSKRWNRHEATGKYFIEHNHMPVTATPRKFSDGETIAAIQCYLYQIDTGEAMEFDFITLVAAVKLLRERILESGSVKFEHKFGAPYYYEKDEAGNYFEVIELYGWDLAA